MKNMIWNDSWYGMKNCQPYKKVLSIHWINHKFIHYGVSEVKWKDWDDEMDKWDEETQSDVCNVCKNIFSKDSTSYWTVTLWS